MKLDTTKMRYLTADDFRVLQAVELGTRNHELVPTQMIHSIGGLKSPSATNRAIGDLAKLKLVARLRNAKYDGFRLTYNGYDYLAIKSMLKRDTLYSVGNTIGVGKESDIYAVGDNRGHQKVLKIHRLGRTSFKTVKNNRDYLKNRQSSNWMYLSRLAAEKEHQFMAIFHENGLPVPCPYDYSRHCVLMEWIDGIPMKHLRKHADHKRLYSQLMSFIVTLANNGIIHCDFNEFNIIVKDDSKTSQPACFAESDFVVIDFPQCVSIDHVDAATYFERDVNGIRAFFEKKFRYVPESDPIMLDTDGFGDGYKHAYPVFARDVKRVNSLDVEVKASGYEKMTLKENRDLERAVEGMRVWEGEYEEAEDEDNSEGVESDGAGFDGESENESDGFQDEYSEVSDSSEDQDNTSNNLPQDDEQNEKIIEALSLGVTTLKMDKLGNYILE